MTHRLAKPLSSALRAIRANVGPIPSVAPGQVKFETVVRSTDLPLRQLGDQEIDIARMVQTCTKYAVMVTDPNTVEYHIDRAFHEAVSGRPGPVWIDIPMDVQSAVVEPARQKRFAAPDRLPQDLADLAALQALHRPISDEKGS